MEKQKTITKIYRYLIFIAAAVIFLFSFIKFFPVTDNLFLLGVAFVFAIILGKIKFRVKEKITITIRFLPIFITYIFFGINSTIVVIFLSCIITDFTEKKGFLSVVFNSSHYSITLFLTHLILQNIFAGSPFSVLELYILFLPSLVFLFFFFVINNLLIYLDYILKDILTFKLFINSLTYDLFSYIFSLAYSYLVITAYHQFSIAGIVVLLVLICGLSFMVQIYLKAKMSQMMANALLEIISSVIGEETTEGILKNVISTLSRVVPCRFTSIWLISPDQPDFVKLKYINKPELLIMDIKGLSIGQGIIGQCAKERKIICIDDIAKTKNYVEGIRGIKSEIALPLIFNNKLLGVIDLEDSEKAFFTGYYQELLSSLSTQISIIINTSILKENLIKQSDAGQKLSLALNKKIDDLFNFIQIISKNISNISESIFVQSNMVSQIKDDLGKSLDSFNMLIENSTVSLESSKSGKKQAENSTKLIDLSISKFKQIVEILDKLTLSIENLNKNSTLIDTSIRAINDIADETNILAFNAAIESARAGEAGAGFGIVAEYIKKLSDQSSETTAQVIKLIQELKREIEESTSSIELEKKIYQESHNIIDSTGIELKEIINIVNDNIQALDITINAFTDQTKSIKELSNILNKMGETSQQNVLQSEEISSSVQQMLNLIGEIRELSKKLETALQ